MIQPYTFVATCFDRLHELEITISSFLKNADILPSQWIFIEDSGRDDINIKTITNKFNLSNILVVKNARNIGQHASIDIAYSLIQNEYIFHCEEDWEFYAGGFIQPSIEILNNYDDIVTVWLRAQTDTNNHEIETCSHRNLKLLKLNHGIQGKWNGFTFNPGLRRLSDYKSIGPYCAFNNERDLSFEHYWLGFRAAILESETGYVRHIGKNSTYGRQW